MTVFQCEKCGATKEGRCKPKKCPQCGAAGGVEKQQAATGPGCGCGCKAKKKPH